MLRRPGFDAPLDAEGVAAVEHAAALLAEAGASVDEADPGLPDTRAIFAGVWGAALSRLVATLPEQLRGLLDPGIHEVARTAERDERDPVPRRRGDARRRCARHGPAAPDVRPGAVPDRAGRPAAGGRADENPVEALWTQWAPWTFTFNLTRQPAITVPMGLRANGLPNAVQLAAAQYREDLVLRAARAIELAEPFPEGPAV